MQFPATKAAAEDAIYEANMRSMAAIAALTVIVATGAEAQSSWQEYTYPDQQFAVSFPSQPTLATMPFKAADGTAVSKTLYTVRQDTDLFQVAVVDFTKAGIDRTTAIGQAVAQLREMGDVKLDIQARVQRNIGRYLNIAGNDGSHTIAAVFFGNNRLYEIEGTIPASNPDALSGEMIRFQQSLRFMGDAAGGRGFRPGFARGQFQGRGRRQNQGQPNQPPASANP
jgi:hypothetical protein